MWGLLNVVDEFPTIIFFPLLVVEKIFPNHVGVVDELGNMI